MFEAIPAKMCIRLTSQIAFNVVLLTWTLMIRIYKFLMSLDLWKPHWPQINSDLEGVIGRSVEYGLELNVSKCTLLHSSRSDLVQALVRLAQEWSWTTWAWEYETKQKPWDYSVRQWTKFSEHNLHNPACSGLAERYVQFEK